ncbi:hypothetical protein [Desulfuromonas sp.]|nr:hypothetical protein [Desulfuromonas sp.]
MGIIETVLAVIATVIFAVIAVIPFEIIAKLMERREKRGPK